MRSSSPDLSAAPVVAARTPPTSSVPVKLRHAWGAPSATAPHSYSQRSRLCRIPNCSEESHFDPNTGVESPYCYNHQNAPHGHLPHAHSAANFEGHQAVGLPHSQSAPSMDDSFNSPSDDDSSGPFITDGGSGPFMSQLVSNFVSYFSPSSSTTWNQQPPQVVQTSPAPGKCSIAT